MLRGERTVKRELLKGGRGFLLGMLLECVVELNLRPAWRLY
jgi:hypothetical protein